MEETILAMEKMSVIQNGQNKLMRPGENMVGGPSI